jgi:hypothetical protein
MNICKFLQVIATAKWFCNCLVSLRPADCVVKPRRCAASPAFYALSTELMKTDHFTKPLRGDYTNEALIPYEFWIKAADLVREIAMNDIAFVTLAEFLGIKLWTGDKELMRGWARKGYTNFITTDELYKLRTLLDG